MSDPSSTSNQGASDEASDKLITCSYCGNTFPESLMSDPIEVASKDKEVKNRHPICKGCRSMSEGLEDRLRRERELKEGEELTITTIDDPLGPERE